MYGKVDCTRVIFVDSSVSKAFHAASNNNDAREILKIPTLSEHHHGNFVQL